MTVPRGERYRGLDGLRGVAALVVVVHHVLLSEPSLAGAYRARPDPQGRVAHWFTFSPLHVAWAGGEAVLVFFVLSGFVLSVGPVGGSRVRWVDYYPRRMVRLYLPVVAALAVALPQARWLRPTSVDPHAGWVYNAHIGSGTLHAFLRDSTVWHEKATFLDGPVWSLHWEVLFSLLLPAYLLLARARSRLAAGAAALALLVMAGVGAGHGWGSLTYLPVFGLGVLVAAQRDLLVEVATRWSPWLAGVGGLLLTARWWLSRGDALPPLRAGVAVSLAVAGAALLVLAFLAGAVGSWAARDRWVRWLGRRSFSLYLVHAPIIISVAYLLGGHPSTWVIALLAVPLSLLAAELFGRFFEEPGHDLSKRLGGWTADRLRPRESVSSPSVQTY